MTKAANCSTILCMSVNSPFASIISLNDLFSIIIYQFSFESWSRIDDKCQKAFSDFVS